MANAKYKKSSSRQKKIPYLSFSGGSKKRKKALSKRVKVKSQGNKRTKARCSNSNNSSSSSTNRKGQKGGFLGTLLASISLPLVSSLISKI